MERRNITYQAPAQLLRSDSLFQKHYTDCLHITATSSLKMGLGESLRDYRWIHAPIITFAEFFSELAGKSWSSSKAQLKQFLQLTDALSELWESSKGERLLQLQAMERNQVQVLKTLRTLTELGIPIPKKAHQGLLNETEELFLQIWSKIEPDFRQDSNQLNQWYSGKTSVEPKVKNALLSWGKSIQQIPGALGNLNRKKSNLPKEDWINAILSSLKKEKLILHGFYFITPIQELVFKLLEKKYDLIFLNCYDWRYPNTFATVKNFLKINEVRTENAVEDTVSIHPLAAKLVESFEFPTKTTIHPTMTAYFDLPQFISEEKKLLEELDEDEEPYHLLTPRLEDVKDQLIANHFIPPTKQKLTDYPVGQFLYKLHTMMVRRQDVNTGEVKLEENITTDLLRDLFASGCLIANGVNMKTFLRPLEKIIPYCKGISTFKGWYDQIKKLTEEKEKWDKIVLKKNKKALSSRTHKFHAFPMRQLSYFSMDLADIEKIVAGIERLETIHEKLFKGLDNKKVNIGSHLQMVEELVLKNVEEHFGQAEKAIVKDIIEDIESLQDEELEFSLKDLLNGLLFYLDGSLREIDDTEQTADDLSGFDRADAAPFQTNRRFHLAFADQKALPIPQGYNLWPVSRQLLSHWEKTHPELALLEERKKMTGSINRYLLYVLFHSADDVRFSYVENLAFDSKLELSMYLNLLGCKTVKPKPNKANHPVGNKKTQSYAVDLRDWTLSMKREAQICPKRASFSFILNEHTTFTDDFHHGFLYENYVTMLSKMAEQYIPAESIRSEVDPWFPQWTEMKKDFRYDDITVRYPKRGYSRDKMNVDGIKYSQAISYFHLIPTSYAGAKVEERLPIENLKLNEASPGKHCRYCPYLAICRDGIYSIDYEEKK